MNKEKPIKKDKLDISSLFKKIINEIWEFEESFLFRLPIDQKKYPEYY